MDINKDNRKGTTKMKRIISLFIALLLVSAFASCADGNDLSSSSAESAVTSSRTEKFYTEMTGTCYFVMTMNDSSGTYSYTQATDGSVTTTIKDYADDDKDLYCIFNGTEIHYLEIADKYYDTTITTNGQKFIFAGYTASAFASPKVSENADFNGSKYYCETFPTASSAGGEVDGEDRYYFDGDRLAGVEVTSGGSVTMTMVFDSYGSGIPDGVLMATPDDFSKGNLNIDTTIDTSGWWD